MYNYFVILIYEDILNIFYLIITAFYSK